MLSGKDDQTEQRICELETRLAFQEDHLQKLNSLVAEQAGAMDVLRHQLRHVYKKLKNLEGIQDQGAEDNQPPPHY